MAFTDELVLDDADGTDVTFRLRSRDRNGSERINIASTASEPHLLSIKHQTTGKGTDVVDRHLVSNSLTVIDSVGKSVTGVVNFSFAIPRNAYFTVEMAYDLAGELIDLMTGVATLSTPLSSTDNVASLLRGES